MRLLNPSYDTVFKYLMEDVEVAKGIISRIIDKEIVELIPLPQETTSIEIQLKYLTLPLHRQDYVAAVKITDEKGEEKIEKIMIELQKSPFKPEVSRFRQYLSDKYHHKTIINNKELDLPITTIYILEKVFNEKLPSVLYVKNQYYDRLTGKSYNGDRDEFVDLLNHESYFIQTSLLPSDFRDNLIRILSIFSPHYKIKHGKSERYINLPENDLNRFKDKILSRIIRRLQLGENDNNLTTALQVEISYEDEWDATLKALKTERKEKQEAILREQKAKQNLIKSAKLMKDTGMTVELISKATGLSEDEIFEL